MPFQFYSIIWNWMKKQTNSYVSQVCIGLHLTAQWKPDSRKTILTRLVTFSIIIIIVIIFIFILLIFIILFIIISITSIIFIISSFLSYLLPVPILLLCNFPIRVVDYTNIVIIICIICTNPRSGLFYRSIGIYVIKRCKINVLILIASVRYDCNHSAYPWYVLRVKPMQVLPSCQDDVLRRQQ